MVFLVLPRMKMIRRVAGPKRRRVQRKRTMPWTLLPAEPGSRLCACVLLERNCPSSSPSPSVPLSYNARFKGSTISSCLPGERYTRPFNRCGSLLLYPSAFSNVNRFGGRVQDLALLRTRSKNSLRSNNVTH